MVGDTSFELVTSCVSSKHSPPELIAHKSVAYCSTMTSILNMILVKKILAFVCNFGIICTHADVAQLVEHNLAKVGVAGSNPVVRSIFL